ncbi:SDR family oxidoreductase [Haloarchaeobius litoreus]|uniref:SDR family oxidoreductase n=1 Tax=Haloarchaeobius litoreus TaxID=755306 RepID=A0ABD6DLK7_9EURY|nr:SDR family NAD(P)-dependent oxidoreductase [Haloarchaeobius litoreus]
MTGTAVIAGVGPKIGEAVARELHDAGYDVGLFARTEAFIEDLAADLGAGALAVPTDVTDQASVEAGMATVRETFGPVSALVLNATGGGGRPVGQANADRLRAIFDVRVAGSLTCVNATLSDLRETEGTVIFSGTTYADSLVPEQLEWGAVGPAARGLSKSLATALDDVQVTYVRIGSRVDPVGEVDDDALSAAEVASTYRGLVERDAAVTRELDLRRR